MVQTDTAAPAPASGIDVTGYALAIGGAALFSTKGIFIKLAYQGGVGAETVLALRMLFAIPFYAAIGFWLIAGDAEMRRLLTPRAIFGSALTGILGYYVASYLDFAGLMFVTAQYERLVLFTYPFFTLALGVMFFGDRMDWRVVPALATSYAGLLVIFGWNLTQSPEGLLAGTSLVLASGLTFALYQHLARRQMLAIGSRVFTCIAMGTAGLLAIAHNTLQNGPQSYLGLGAEIWGCGIALGILGTVVPSFMLNGAISRIGARATSSTGAWGPILTIALAVAILGEVFTIYHALGAALVIGGSIMFGRTEQRTRRQLAQPAPKTQ